MSATASFTIKRGDIGHVIEAILSNSLSGSLPDLTGCTVTAILRHGKTWIVQTAVCSIVGAPTDGRVRFITTSNHSALAGRLFIEWRVIAPGGNPTTYPSEGYLSIDISPDLGT